jgi:hypothetical protein
MQPSWVTLMKFPAIVRSFLKAALKWAFIIGAAIVGTTLLQGVAFETRMIVFLVGLGMAIAYVDGSHKDRISMLEYRIDELEQKLLGYRHR